MRGISKKTKQKVIKNYFKTLNVNRENAGNSNKWRKAIGRRNKTNEGDLKRSPAHVSREDISLHDSIGSA